MNYNIEDYLNSLNKRGLSTISSGITKFSLLDFEKKLLKLSYKFYRVIIFILWID